MANAYNPILLAGTQAQFDALAGTYVEGKLYFITDTGKLYRANSSSTVTDFTDDIVVWPATSTDVRPAAPIEGKIYINKKNGNVETYVGSAWEIISLPNVTTVGSASDDDHVPTAKAVWDAIEAAVGTDGIVKSIAQKMTDDATPAPVIGTIEVTNADETTYDVALAGLAKLPTYQASDRTFTFTDTSGGSLVVTLGKDEFLDPTANNRYENGYIYLYLNVPDPSVPGSTNTELQIDVSDLIDTYTCGDTTTVDMTLDPSTHVFTADVVVRPDVAGTFTNALKVNSTEGAKGLYVDLSTIETDIYNLQNLTANSSDLVDMVLDHDAELDNIYAAWGWGTFS